MYTFMNIFIINYNFQIILRMLNISLRLNLSIFKFTRIFSLNMNMIDKEFNASVNGSNETKVGSIQRFHFWLLYEKRNVSNNFKLTIFRESVPSVWYKRATVYCGTSFEIVDHRGLVSSQRNTRDVVSRLGKELVSSRERGAGPQGMPHLAGMCYNGSLAGPPVDERTIPFFGRNQTNRCGPHLDPEDPQPLFRFSRLSTKCLWYSDPAAIHAIARIANHLWRFWAFSVVAVVLSKRRNAKSFVRCKRVPTLSTDIRWTKSSSD